MKALPRARKEIHRSYDPRRTKDPQKLTLALEMHRAGRYDEAAQLYYELDRDHPPHWHARMMAAILVHTRANEHEQAIDLLKDVILHVPKWPDPRYNLGTILEGMGRFEEAEKYFRQCIELDEGYPQAWVNLGNTRLALGDVSEAVQCFARGLAIDPANLLGQYNLMHPLGLLGQWEKTYELHELRWGLPGHLADHGHPAPVAPWRGDPFPPGTRLLVTDEQGVGDIIQFSRFLKQLTEMVGESGKVICRVRNDGLRELLAFNFPAVEFVDSAARPAVHFHVPLLSCVYRLGISEEALDGSAYLRAPEPGPWFNPVAVGLCWAGSALHKRDGTRSIPFDIFERILSVPGFRFVNLMVGEHARPEDPRFAYGLGAGPSYSQTAAIIAGLDLVISVDTSVMHLAGALGVPTWGLIASAPDFRWMLGRTDSPWYDSLTLYRQERAGDWATVMDRLAHDLEALAP